MHRKNTLSYSDPAQNLCQNGARHFTIVILGLSDSLTLEDRHSSCETRSDSWLPARRSESPAFWSSIVNNARTSIRKLSELSGAFSTGLSGKTDKTDGSELQKRTRESCNLTFSDCCWSGLQSWDCENFWSSLSPSLAVRLVRLLRPMTWQSIRDQES